jgi:hypothetical protein
MTKANAQPHNDSSQKVTSPAAPIDKVVVSTVEAAIWRNLSKAGDPFFSITFERKYRDHGGKWKRSNNFNFEDLLPLAKIVYLVQCKVEELRTRDCQMKRPIR